MPFVAFSGKTILRATYNIGVHSIGFHQNVKDLTFSRQGSFFRKPYKQQNQ
jgi:hypothetical protein